MALRSVAQAGFSGWVVRGAVTVGLQQLTEAGIQAVQRCVTMLRILCQSLTGPQQLALMA